MQIKFLWANEDTGFRHLYVVTSQITPRTNGGFTDSPQVSLSLPPCIFSTINDSGVGLRVRKPQNHLERSTYLRQLGSIGSKPVGEFREAVGLFCRTEGVSSGETLICGVVTSTGRDKTANQAWLLLHGGV